MRRILIPALTLVYLGVIFLLCFSKGPAKGEDEKAERAKEGYTGVESCQTCHFQVYEQLTKTTMGTLFLKHPPTADEKLGCETCHGPGTDHVDSGGKTFEGMVRFTKESPTPISVRNDVCLNCHQKRERLFWAGSAHETEGLACTSCHAVHTGPGITVRAQLANITVGDTCLTCHKEQVRAELQFSHHPLREGKMDCASCHNPHGTTSAKLVKGLSNKELCFNCHAQYRGPFVFQHPPVIEDCFNCHKPHGSAYPSLLKSPPIRLCRECHITYHNVNFTVGGQPQTRVNMMAGGGCINCHRSIHGSNNVNGNLFSR
ncbi:MAG: DmsE family decaheme c-type cytochrome [Thermodesulfobacteriota bacterium]|jgi:DmsE family decaheme c-type cytochrome|nr:MAG: DmsE family decaheme c-type cytochrome [Thermodesulfobacteriota bacterium]